MKKILMLGGSHFQVPSIIRAKELGCYVITCDYIPQNPGHKYSDEYYNISTTDFDSVLNLAKKLNINGIVCYASDPAAPTAAYVAEQLGLPTNPYNSVKILTNKDLFRTFLEKNRFNTPKAKGYSSLSEVMREFQYFNLPVMIKPVDSSGSKGVSKVNKFDELTNAVKNALIYSRKHRFIVEEYVEKFGYQIAGDGFSVDGNLVFRCFANEHFDSNGVNPFVPIGESWPYIMPERVHDKVHREIQRALNILNMGTGAYNFDIRIDKNENVYIMELGPRNGGNLIPQVIKYATGVDMVEYTIKAALGENCSDIKMKNVNGYWSCYMIHTNNSGIYDSLKIDKDITENNLIELNMLCNRGDYIESFTGSNGTLGTAILRYKTKEEMLYKMENMNKFINIKIKEQY